MQEFKVGTEFSLPPYYDVYTVLAVKDGNITFACLPDGLKQTMPAEDLLLKQRAMSIEAMTKAIVEYVASGKLKLVDSKCICGYERPKQ